ncbi:MAG: glycosyltransferase family 4 protein [Methanobacteriota archaeon]|nr:MAG: glycosyltransferase family 4 protein [Euryarchaeota archaeon]
MRVLFAIAHLGKGGGVALQAFQLYRNLRRLIDIRLVCLDARGPHRALTQEPGVSVAGTLGFPTGILSLRKALRSSRRDFDLFHILDPFYASPAAYLARVTPRVVSLGTDPGREIADRFGPAFGTVARATMVPLLSDGALVVNSTALADRFRHYRPRVIPNGLDRTKFEHLPTREDARKRLGLPPERTILSYVGKVIPEKRVEWLLEIARHLPNVEAVIVGGYSEEYYGDRYYRSLLSKYADIRERTRFVGEVSWDLVPSYLAASDVFVYPSPWEGSPNAVMEAMAAGLPVVVSDIPAHREIVEHGKTGFIARDPQSMTRFADTLERDPGLREEIGSRARALVFERFSMEACAQAHLEFYRSILAS